jgi:Resolvase, N terminal domain
VAGRTIAYCRVSTRDQNPQLQLDALAGHGYDLLFTEKVSSRLRGDRPRFAAALAEAAAGDTLVFWKSDPSGGPTQRPGAGGSDLISVYQCRSEAYPLNFRPMLRGTRIERSRATS